ncbi:MAG: hypothetical protein IKP61_02760 [Spirochaetales bacterium]|nr:hypothetical protein [Spirochaetales bacterium]
MKRFLLILFLVLSLLVSCATKAPKSESPAQQTQSSAIDSPAQEQENSPEEPEVLAPVEEAAAETEPDSEEQPVAEQEVVEETAPVEEAPEETVPVADEQDWSQVISAAPAATVEEQKPQAEPAVEAAPAQTKTEERTAEPAKAQSQVTTAARIPSSLADKLIAFIKKVGTFVADQVLLSIGIFVCIGGFIYLIAALVISGRRDRERAKARSRKKRAMEEESEAFSPSSDTDPETDEDFLKRLLGDGNE